MDTGLNSLKTASKKVIHKAAEAAREFIGNKIAAKTVKPKHVTDESPRNVQEIIIPSEKKRRNIKQIKTSIIKMEHYEISMLLNISTVLKFVTKNGLK